MRLVSTVLAVSLLAAGQAVALPLVNGGFEQPGIAGVHYLTPGSTFITGWTTIDATPGGDNDVAILDNASFGGFGVHPSQGNYFVDLTGNVGKGKGLFSDPIAAIIGQQYHLAFDVGAFFVAGFGSYGNATVDLLVNDVLVGSYTNIQSLTVPGSDWETFGYNFIASTSTVKLTFLSSKLATSSNLGVGLDNVTFGAVGGGVPEPETWTLMIAGFGLSGVMLRRRRDTATCA